MTKDTATQIVRHENQDSIDIGAPSKGGAIKVYGDFLDPETFKTRINNAVCLRLHAQIALAESEGKPVE